MSSLEDRWRRELDGLRAVGRYRELRAAGGHDFTSNDYLGYAKRPYRDDAELSTSGSASRLLRGQHELWDEVERRLAEWHGTEAALVFNSGYVANEGLLSTIVRGEDWVASDELNHASIIDGLRLTRCEKLVYVHNHFEQLEEGLRKARPREKFVVTESLLGMEADITPLPVLAEMAEKHGAHLIVDEAHATGCFGPRGSGLVDAAGLRPRVLATVHTGGKALGVPGAYVVGSGRLRELLINRCRQFLYTTALPPRAAAWWIEALDRVQNDDHGRARLRDNVAFFRRLLRDRQIFSLGQDYIVPIGLGDDSRAVAVAARLQAAGFDVRAIRPPTVPLGAARIRISIHADHSAAVLESLAAALADALRGMP